MASLTGCKITKFYPGQSHPIERCQKLFRWYLPCKGCYFYLLQSWQDSVFLLAQPSLQYVQHSWLSFFFYEVFLCHCLTVHSSVQIQSVIQWLECNGFVTTCHLSRSHLPKFILCLLDIQIFNSSVQTTASFTVFGAYISHPSSLSTTSTSEMDSKCLNTRTRGTFRHIWVSIMKFMPKDVVC